ncbi:MAG: methyltransferase domain-containing protein [Candidatus Moraniibacteriota bacterium]
MEQYSPERASNAPKWDKVYAGNHNEIPWNFEEAPVWFQEIIQSGWVKPGKTLDVGCGLGNYANYLSSNGFDVLGVDFSQKAIETNQHK